MHIEGKIKFEIILKSDEQVVSEMPIEKGMLNPYGVVNAGAIIWFADVTASILLFEGSELPEKGMKGFPLAINVNANLIGNSREGKFIATSSYVKKGRTVSVVRTEVVSEAGKVIADVTTNHVRSS